MVSTVVKVWWWWWCREQDRYLPIANISRIMKRILPPNAKVAKETKDVVQECVSEFISFITSECVVCPCVYGCVCGSSDMCPACRASDKCQREKRKTINGDDLLWAMEVLFFKEYLEPLTLYLQKFREAEKLALAGAAAKGGQHGAK